MSSVPQSIDPETGEIMPMEMEIKGSAMFTVFISHAPESEQQRICKDMDTFVAEFERFRDMLPKVARKVR